MANIKQTANIHSFESLAAVDGNNLAIGLLQGINGFPSCEIT